MTVCLFMLYLTKHERSVVLFLAAVVICGLIVDAFLKLRPQSGRPTTFEEKFVYQTNVNTADFDELVRVPYIGEVTARAILEYRNAHGPIRSLEEIRLIPVIYPSNYEKMIKYLKL